MLIDARSLAMPELGVRNASLDTPSGVTHDIGSTRMQIDPRHGYANPKLPIVGLAARTHTVA